MLLEYTFKNFHSFGEEAYFSLRATEDARKNFPDNYIHGSCDVLRSAVMVGENAGGKSNFMKSLSYLKSLFKENSSVESSLKHICDSYNDGDETTIDKTAQSFSIAALIDGYEYRYELGIDCLGIKHESFATRTAEQADMKLVFVLNRSEENIALTDTVGQIQLKNRGDKPLIELKYELSVDSATSVVDTRISAALQSSEDAEHDGLNITKFAILGVKPAVAFSKWMNDTLFVNVSPDGEYYSASRRLTKEDLRILEKKSQFLPILKMADSSIVDFTLDARAPFSGTVILREDAQHKRYEHDLISDSAGIRDYFPLAIQIFKIIYQDKVVFADEMDRALNPVLTDKILSFINGSEHTGQFVFTTHNVLHLNLGNYMKEQIYFVTKNPDTLQSELYSLADFPEIEYGTGVDLYELYLRGVLGGTLNE